MSVFETDQIDTMGVVNGNLELLIIDTCNWEFEEEHFELLEDKLNNYLLYLDSKQYVPKYGDDFDKIIISIHPARIGPTVWEEEGPMPTRNRSTTESGRGETDKVGLFADTESACITQLFHSETCKTRKPGKPRHPTPVSRRMGWGGEVSGAELRREPDGFRERGWRVDAKGAE